MLNREEIEELLDCSKCKLKECIGCDITYTDKKNLREYIEQLEKTIFDINGKNHDLKIENGVFLLEKQKLIEKLEKDIVNITKVMQDGKHNDYYSKCRLKAYKTKTKEILVILKGESDD